LHDEMEWLVKGGFTPSQALEAATLKPAQFLGKMDKYGLVEPGRVADLVLLDENPLDDIRNTRKIFGVVANGKYYSRQELDAMLQQVEKLAAQQ
jgi:imidazolonepropionase-like amidohydrolase